MIVPLCNLTGISAVLLRRCPSNFIAIGEFKTWISWLLSLHEILSRAFSVATFCCKCHLSLFVRNRVTMVMVWGNKPVAGNDMSCMSYGASHERFPHKNVQILLRFAMPLIPHVFLMLFDTCFLCWHKCWGGLIYFERPQSYGLPYANSLIWCSSYTALSNMLHTDDHKLS